MRKQQGVQTDDLPGGIGNLEGAAFRRLPANFAHTLLHSPPTPLPQEPRKSNLSSAYPKAKLVFAYETSDIDGLSIAQPCMWIDEEERQVKLVRPDTDSSPNPGAISSAPKNFPFNGAFSNHEPMSDFCVNVLSDQMSSLVNGNNGCVIYLNSIGRRDVSRFIGNDSCTTLLGLVPSAIKWLFDAMNDRMQQRAVHFCLAVSATEIYENNSVDLLIDFKKSTALEGDGKSSKDRLSGTSSWKKICSSRSDDEATELVATNVVEAARYLDMALAASKRLHDVHLNALPAATTNTSVGHLFFTFHIYRNFSGGVVTASNKIEHRQLNLIELMVTTESEVEQKGSAIPRNSTISNFILSLVSGRASPPFGTKEPILHHLLRSCLLAEELLRITFVLHTSVHPKFYDCTLELLQHTTKIQHAWKRRLSSKSLRSTSHRRQTSAWDRVVPSTAASNNGIGNFRFRRLGRRLQKRRVATGSGQNSNGRECGDDDVPDSSSDLEYTSSSEQSCTTVIYLGRSHPLRTLSTPDRPKRLVALEPKVTVQKTEEVSNTVPVCSPFLPHHRRFKSRAGHKASVATATNELWVDGPRATAPSASTSCSAENLGHLETASRSKSDSVSEKDQSSIVPTQATVEKGVPDGKSCNAHTNCNLERKLEVCSRWPLGPADSLGGTRTARQLEAILTPRSDRKLRRGDAYLERKQLKQIDQCQQTTTSTEFPVLAGRRHDAFPVGSSGAVRGVKPFVKEWVERQNQAIAGCLTDKPTSPKHGHRQMRIASKIEKHCQLTSKTPETPRISQKHREPGGKKQVDVDDITIPPNDPTTHSRSLPRHATADMLWPAQSHQAGPTLDNLSRVARWVESVSTPEPALLPPSIGCSKHPHFQSPLCKNCNKGISHGSTKSPEVSGRGSSAPAARHRSRRGPVVFHSTEDTQMQQPHPTVNISSDPRKPDGASDPGLNRDRSFGSVSGLDTITEGFKFSPLRKPVLKRFADLFVCSPSTNRHRQQYAQQQSGQVSKMCAPLFGGSGKPQASEEDSISIDSAGMLFTSLSKGGRDESLFLESEQTGQAPTSGNQHRVDRHCEEGQGGLRIKEAGAKHRFGFLQSPLFGKRSTSRACPDDITPTSHPSLQASTPFQGHYQKQQQDSMAFHCQIIIEKSPQVAGHHKCVSQSSSSGLGSEHSEQHSLRCHCCSAQGEIRARRCRMRAHRNRGSVAMLTDVEIDESPLTNVKCSIGGSGGGHASSGYESVLRDDSEISSRSSSGGSYPSPAVGAKEAACQTMPSELDAGSPAAPQGTPMISDVLTASFTETVTVSATGDTMLASVTSKTSGERTISSKRSLSAPAGSSEESRSSSLPSVRRASPAKPLHSTGDESFLTNAVYPRTAQHHVRLKELIRVNSDEPELPRATLREEKITALLRRQEVLKNELTAAKTRLLADPGSWSFDLNVAERMDPNDEGYLEALADETELLQQRVDACRSHAQYLAFFQHPPPPLNPHEPPH
uniref:Kinesin motor domain-containing protein n=1 Tax=Mesocestoides corti TaxID=53468 RepID=A0A5K3EGU6_MESCO